MVHLGIRRRIRPWCQRALRSRLHNPAFTIIASNCWGTAVYQDLGLAYTTPFVGLMIYAPDYLRLLSNLRGYMAAPLEFINHSKYDGMSRARAAGRAYPIGLLGGEVEIHFQHYASTNEAMEKWDRRLARVHWDNLFYSFTDKDLCTKEMLSTFDQLPYSHKVCFTARNYPDLTSTIWIHECADELYVTDIYTHRELVWRHFDVVDWLNGGTGQTGWIQRRANLLLASV